MIGKIAAPTTPLVRIGWGSNPFWSPPIGPKTAALHRFDDPARLFQTLYFAEDVHTAISEVLQEFRPDPVDLTNWIANGYALPSFPVKPVPPGHFTKNVLAWATIKAVKGEPFANLFDQKLRQTLFIGGLNALTTFYDRVKQVGLPCDFLDYDVWALTGPWRSLTQPIAQALYARGFAGARFPSKITDRACWVIFLDRTDVTPVGSYEPLDSAPHHSLVQGILADLRHGFLPPP